MNDQTVLKTDPTSANSQSNTTQQPQTDISGTINPPFRNEQFIANKKLTEADFEKLESAIGEQERLLFVVVGDLNVRNRYARCVLAITNKKIYGFDDAVSGGVNHYSYSQIEQAQVKRYYGNAMLVLTMAGAEENSESKKRVNFLRFSYTEASLFDAAASFISGLAADGDLEDELERIKMAFEKQFSVCPKCGRSLIRPGATCLKCQSKGTIIQKLGKYILPYKWTLILCVLVSMVTISVSLVPPYMTKILVDDVLPKGNKTGLAWCVFVLVVTNLIHYGVGALRNYHMRVVGDKIVADLRNDVYQKAQHLPLRFYDRTSTGSVINRISGDSSTIQSFMLRISQEVLLQCLLLVGIVIIMLTMNWQLTLLSLIPVPFVAVGSRRFGKKIRPFYRKVWRRWSAVTNVLTDTIPGIRVIKAFASEKRSIQRFNARNDEWMRTDIQIAKIATAFPNIVGFIIACGSLMIWGVGGQLVIDNPAFISPGLLVSFISYTSMFYGPVNFFANLNDSYQSFLNAAERLLDIVDAEPESNFAEGKHPDRLVGKIEFRNVNFSFDRSKKILSDMNFVIEPGDIVGIVGTTGAGKTTLINLLMRYYDNYDGEILVDDINIRDIDMTFYRTEIGYVQQEPMMFHDTIYNNIAYGSETAQVEDVLHAADVANAHSFISRLPDGYDTVLGERGIGLSGGERQRLSIARAVLKNPSILFFDEATASVDSETEHLIQEAIEKLIHGRTTLMIAHRLSTLRKANKIIVVDKGKILEMGTPEELLAQKGKYYKLIEIQTMSDQLRKTKLEERFE